MTYFLIALVLGLVEGLTEFVPVSSTGHLILVGDVLGFKGTVAQTFEIFIQLGAILAVVVEYRKKLFKFASLRIRREFSGVNALFLIAVATLPALFIGKMSHGFIKEHLFNSSTVAIGLAGGALWILATEKFIRYKKPIDIDYVTWKQALAIGFFQCAALWPGVSRAAATILGGMSVGLDRKSATKFSFFAAVPILFAACLYDLYKNISSLQASEISLFAVGFVVSFFSAWLAVRFLIRYLSKHTLIPFAWYRIALAILVFLVLSR